MILPKFIARWIDKQVSIADIAHVTHCRAHGVSPDDVDPPESWRENLHLWFPLDIVEGSWQRTIDWGEIWASIEIPMWQRLGLCKLGWHRYGMVHRWENYAGCLCGHKKHGYTPRWAR